MRRLVAIKFENPHYLANIFALNRILGIAITTAKLIYRSDKGSWIDDIDVGIHSDLTTDELISKLEEYGVKVKIINQNNYESNRINV